MKLRRFLSCMMALLLVCGLPLSALAEEYDLAKGSITVTAKEDGQYVTQTNGVTNHKEESETVITQSNSSETSTTNSITIKAEENATANVTLEEVNIVISDDVLTNHGDEAAVTIDVADNASANVTLDGVNIDVSGTGGDIIFDYFTGEAAVKITGNGDVTLELDGESTVQSGYYRAGVEKNTTDDGSNGKGNLTITDETGFSGSLKATGGYEGAGIGGGYEGAGSNITITGSAEVTAQGGVNSAGIGGGCWCGGSDITIKGSAKVTAQGGEGSAGIGGGYDGSGSNINISGSAEVIATGGKYGAGIGGGLDGSGSYINISGSAEVIAAGGISGAGIGGGYNLDENGTGSNVTVSKDAQVKAQGGKSDQDHNVYYGAGAAIGGGGKWSDNSSASITGREITPYTGNLGRGWIATYAPGTEDMNTANPKRLTCRVQYIVPIEATSYSAQAIPKREPTCTEDGTRAGFVFEIFGTQVTVGEETLPATGHSMGKFHTETAPTCQQAGLERSDCKNCDHYVTRSLGTVGHSYGEYTSDNNATCTSDGTKSRKCIWCQEPDPVTLPDPGSKLKHELEFHTVTAPTCQQEGLERGDCKNCNYYETNILKKVDHSYGEYTSNNNATCTSDGTKTRKCIWCNLPDTVPDTGTMLKHELEFHTVTAPTCQQEGLERGDCKNCNYYETSPLKKVDHSYGEYTSNNNATCTSDGTKTRKCIWCDLPDTVPDTGTMLKHELGKSYTVTQATCKAEGLERSDCKNCNYYETGPLKKVDHRYGEYTSNNNATCTSDGTKTHKCIWCGLEDTVPDPGTMKEHSFTNYISNNDATYDSDGTKTAKCDHCDATDTLPDPGSKLVREDAAQTAPLYRVVGQDGKDLACKPEQKDGVLTITVDADFAALTGKLSGMQTLKAHGIDTIVFVTKGATSTFAVEDLLAQGASGDSYQLTHDGSAVTFTLNDSTDIRNILK